MQRSTDVSQVRRLLALYCQLMDDRRYDEWSRLFAADGVWALGGREYRGPAEAKGYMDQLLHERPRRRTKHLNTNLVVELDGDAGHVTSDYAMLTREASSTESSPETAEVPWTPLAFGRYLDRVVRAPDGTSWLFAERRLTIA